MLFFTHTRSTKASEIDANLRAALVFLWSASGRQVRAPHCIGGRAVARPTGWAGYVVSRDEIEFRQGRPDHLHDRVRYRRDAGGWRIEWLAP